MSSKIIESKKAEKQIIEAELDNYLAWRLASLRNIIDMTLLSLRDGAKNLVPTGIETIYEKAQGLIEDYCINEETEIKISGVKID